MTHRLTERGTDQPTSYLLTGRTDRPTDHPTERQTNRLPNWTSFIMQQPPWLDAFLAEWGGLILTVQEERKIETLLLSMSSLVLLVSSVSLLRERRAAMQPRERGNKRGAMQ